MGFLDGRQFKRTTLQLWLLLAVLLGLGCAAILSIITAAYLIILLLPAILVRRHSLTLLLLAIALGLSLGWWRGLIFIHSQSVYEGLFERKVTVQGQAITDGNYNSYQEMSVDVGKARLDDGTHLPGKLLISGFGANTILQGDYMEVSGKLMPAYGTYSAKISYAQITILEHHPALVPDIRRRFATGMQNALPEPLASFAMGLLVGQRATLPDDVKQDLLMVGLTHIIAVSGYNLTIILRASKGLFAKQSKRLAVGFSISLTLVFLLLAGSSASIVRAAIVSMLSIWAAYYGRTIKPLNLIVLAAVITAGANPLYLWKDISWYLSFLAFFGVVVFSPLLASRLKARLRNSLLVMVALESICAEIMTLPYVLHNFGQMSLIGLPANVLVVALIPLAMLLSLIAGLAGMFLASLAGWVALPAKLLLIYMLDVAHMLAHIPHIFLQNLGLTITQMLLLYAVVGLITTLMWFKSKSKTAIITDK